jgi:selenocysteine lyase/cysteine desulfurase
MTQIRQIGNTRFSVPEGIYLLNHAVGCLPDSAAQASAQFIDQWAAGACESWGTWLAAIDEFHSALTRLLHGEAQNFCHQTNLSSGLCKILSALPASGRKVMLLSEMDFPSMSFAAQKMATHLGWELRFIADDNGLINLEDWDAALTTDVKVALIMHSCSNNSYLNPVADISRLCHKRGIVSIVDVAQSVGVVPIDLRDWQVDFVLGTSVKWLCGGQGACFLWASDEMLRQCEPSDVGWFSHEEPFEMDIHNFRYHPAAKRFWGGTPSVQPAMIAAASIGSIMEIGVAKIRSHNLALKAILRDASLQHGHTVNTPVAVQFQGGTICISLRDHAAHSERLRAAGVHHDNRPRFGMRLSPHIYNTEDEIREVAELLRP